MYLKRIIVDENKIKNDDREKYLTKLNNVKKVIKDYLKIKNEILQKFVDILKEDISINNGNANNNNIIKKVNLEIILEEILRERNRKKISPFYIKLILDIINDIKNDGYFSKISIETNLNFNNYSKDDLLNNIVTKFIDNKILDDLKYINEEITDYYENKCNKINSIICSNESETKLYMCKENEYCNEGKKEIENFGYICDGECNIKQ